MERKGTTDLTDQQEERLTTKDAKQRYAPFLCSRLLKLAVFGGRILYGLSVQFPVKHGKNKG
ncbi:hypothetical protein FACS1894161_2340 [Spirochaetia bacterium]|nr:hypothetical protein FACS1894161_2340 [Spirochaetia bacterium]